ncbi:hypothetical protein RUM44_001141 [Polyplax serrata]|uniref:Uncharacterized protein n=1 Tax=Polyplax serrata TaxID=468196 RepID=A0ABR1B6Q2_POLSC
MKSMLPKKNEEDEEEEDEEEEENYEEGKRKKRFVPEPTFLTAFSSPETAMRKKNEKKKVPGYRVPRLATSLAQGELGAERIQKCT